MANVPMLEWQKKLDITCGVGCVYSEELMLESKKNIARAMEQTRQSKHK